MSHVTLRSGYPELVERLNRFPQGAPPSETLFKILKILFSEREAGLMAQLPIKPFTAAQAGKIWKMDLTETRQVLDELAGRAILRESGDIIPISGRSMTIIILCSPNSPKNIIKCS